MPIPTPRMTQDQRDKDARASHLLDLINTPDDQLIGATMTAQEVYRVKNLARDEVTTLLRSEWL